MPRIEIGTCADAAVIAELHQATVSVAYRGFFPGHPPPTRAELVEVWTGRLAWPGAVALVARLEGQPAGSVMAHPDPEAGGGQLAGLHVLPAHWGQGIGGALHDAALTLLAQAGHRTAALWVLAPNIRARRMYERRGWQLGAETQAGPHGVPEVRYYRDLP